jgi:hypothetical protein
MKVLQMPHLWIRELDRTVQLGTGMARIPALYALEGVDLSKIAMQFGTWRSMGPIVWIRSVPNASALAMAHPGCRVTCDNTERSFGHLRLYDRRQNRHVIPMSARHRSGLELST